MTAADVVRMGAADTVDTDRVRGPGGRRGDGAKLWLAPAGAEPDPGLRRLGAADRT